MFGFGSESTLVGKMIAGFLRVAGNSQSATKKMAPQDNGDPGTVNASSEVYPEGERVGREKVSEQCATPTRERGSHP